jgi:exodeoxyribonuclease VII small subunit
LTLSAAVGTCPEVAIPTAKPKRPKARRDEGDSPANAEALLGRLEQVVRELESGELPLEQALARFEEGIRLVRDGELMLSTVEQRIEILLSDDRVAEFATTAVDPDEAGEDEPAEQPQ